MAKDDLLTTLKKTIGALPVKPKPETPQPQKPTAQTDK